jgi:hypothetical protein
MVFKLRTQNELESAHEELHNVFDFCQGGQLCEERERQHTQSVNLLEGLASNCRKISEENIQLRQKISRLKTVYDEGHKKVQERREKFQRSLSPHQRLREDPNKLLKVLRT